MSFPLPPWLPSVVSDLREVSADLLEPGLAPKTQVAVMSGHGPLLRNLLPMADLFFGLVPQLLAETTLSTEGSSGDWLPAMVPRGARTSTAPHDYGVRDGVILPLRWLRFDAEQRPDENALRWLLHLCDYFRQRLRTHGVRLERQLEEALLVRSGESTWAAQDAQTLRGLGQDVRRRLVAAREAESNVRALARRHLYGSERAPIPYPKQPAWNRLRRLVQELLNPDATLGAMLSNLLSEPIEVADVPFLYQRWCGVHLVRAFEQMGWTRRGDLVGALSLGGHIELLDEGGGQVTVWIEPRVSRATMPITGWGCSTEGDELTPDFLIACGAAGTRDAFVLDATLSTSDAVLSTKAKYRSGIVGVDTLLIAGVPVSRRPLQAWAIAPLGGNLCRLNDPDGRTGSIPLHPGRKDLRALEAWVGDVSLHARRQTVRPSVS